MSVSCKFLFSFAFRVCRCVELMHFYHSHVACIYLLFLLLLFARYVIVHVIESPLSGDKQPRKVSTPVDGIKKRPPVAATPSKTVSNIRENFCNIYTSVTCNAGCTLSPTAFGEILKRELHETRLRKCDFLHSYCELSIHKKREQSEGVHRRVRIKHVHLWFSVADVRVNRNFDFFFFSKITHLPECINACRCLFPNFWKYPEVQIEKKTIENKDEYVSESVLDFGAWHEATARWNTRPFDSNITDC